MAKVQRCVGPDEQDALGRPLPFGQSHLMQQLRADRKPLGEIIADGKALRELARRLPAGSPALRPATTLARHLAGNMMAEQAVAA